MAHLYNQPPETAGDVLITEPATKAGGFGLAFSGRPGTRDPDGIL